ARSAAPRTATARSRPPSRWSDRESRSTAGESCPRLLSGSLELTRRRELPEVLDRGRGDALQGLKVHPVQPEARAPRLEPFEVVEQAPVQIRADVDAFGPRVEQRAQVLVNERGAPLALAVVDAVLRHPHRQLVALETLQDLGEAFRVVLP